MPKPADPLRAFLSGSSAKKGKKSPPVLCRTAPLSADPPADLPEAAATHWRRIVTDSPPGILEASDGIALRMLCELLLEKDEQRCAMRASRLSIIRELMNDLGMMPVARQRLIAALGLQPADSERDGSGWAAFDDS